MGAHETSSQRGVVEKMVCPLGKDPFVNVNIS